MPVLGGARRARNVVDPAQVTVAACSEPVVVPPSLVRVLLQYVFSNCLFVGRLLCAPCFPCARTGLAIMSAGGGFSSGSGRSRRGPRTLRRRVVRIPCSFAARPVSAHSRARARGPGTFPLRIAKHGPVHSVVQFSASGGPFLRGRPPSNGSPFRWKSWVPRFY